MKKFFFTITFIILFSSNLNSKIINKINIEGNNRISKETIILFGNIKKFSIKEYQDLTRIEFYYLLPYGFLTIILGIYPELIISYIYLV